MDKSQPAAAPAETPKTDNSPTASPEPVSPKSKSSKKKLFIIGGVVAAVLVLAGGALALFNKDDKPAQHASFAQCVSHEQSTGKDKAAAEAACSNTAQGGDLGNANSTDAVEKGKALSGGSCEGTGSKKLGSAPMRPEEMSIIVPYGLLAGGHVTPIDHQYYWGKNQFGNADMYDVLAPADGYIVGVQYRDRSQEGGKIKGDYRVVISYSCTFFSYFDLATSLSEDIQKQLPADWEHSGGSPNTRIAVKQGQVVGKVGGQSLDFAVWDTTKSLKNLLVPEAYNVAEPWKIVTVPPLDYFADEVKAKILPLYGRSAEPRDGVIDQDIDGKFVGNWFVEGTYGYAGSAQFTGGEYHKGHLALVHDLYLPGSFWFSIGEFNGQPRQFVFKNPSVTPDKADASSGLVKYELAQGTYTDENGAAWIGQRPAKSLKLKAGATQGTALVQMLEKRKLKVEVFPGKSPSQVSGFTSAAKIYTRGEDAKNSPTIQNPGAPTSTAH